MTLVKRQVVLGKPIPTEDVLRLSQTLGGRIALARHAKGLSQWDLGKEVHRHQSVISLWERGHVDPTDDELNRLVKALRCTKSYLLTAPVIIGAASTEDDEAA